MLHSTTEAAPAWLEGKKSLQREEAPFLQRKGGKIPNLTVFFVGDKFFVEEKCVSIYLLLRISKGFGTFMFDELAVGCVGVLLSLHLSFFGSHAKKKNLNVDFWGTLDDLHYVDMFCAKILEKKLR